MTLWHPSQPFPHFEALSPIDGAKYLRAHTLNENGYHFLLGAAVIKHKGILRVSFAHSLKTENDDRTRLTEKYSTDDGNTWQEHVIADTENGYGRSHGVYFPYGDALYVFCPCAQYDRIDRYPDLKMEAYRLCDDGKYEYLGFALSEDFWPMCEPIALDHGGFLMAGLKADNGTAAIALCDGKDLLHWEMKVLPNPKNYHYWGETTVWKRPDRLIAIVRGSASFENVLVSESFDDGNTWSPLTESNFPSAHSKLYAGTLSRGLSYLVFNMRNRGYRDTLAIAIGQEQFEKVYLIRDGFDAPPKYWKTNEWSYPYAYEDREAGILYVGYAHNKENCEVIAIPKESLTR